MHYAIDFEAFYGDEISVKTLGAFNYARTTDIFMVGIYGPGIEYAGPLEDAPWPSGHHWVSHNASFDETLFHVAKAKGQIRKPVAPSQWSCTADLSAYCLLGRKLADAARYGLGVNHSKSIRDRAGNKKWPVDFKPAYQEDFKKYCLEDARLCWLLWEKYSPRWPAQEQEFARIIRKRSTEGVCIDQSRLALQKSVLIELRNKAAEALPWDEPYLAIAQVRTHCKLLGIEAPKSLAEDSEDAAEWEARYGDSQPIIGQIRAYRKANIMLRKIEAMEKRIMPDGRMNFTLKYHGADATGRLSGGDGLNVQNLNREAYQGVDLRRLLVAGPGKKFIIADFAQIEPRITAWVTNNTGLLSRLQEGVSFYEEDARVSGVWHGEPGTFKKTDPQGYQAQKAQSLGIGYGMGPPRFCKAAKDQLNLTVEPWEARTIIDSWHFRNPGVKPLWDVLESDFKLSYSNKEPYLLTLPSGRSLTYMEIGTTTDAFGRLKYTAKNKFGPRWKSYWGGSLFENLIQATARDILRDAVVACERAGIPVRFSAHDEIVAEVDEEFDSKTLKAIMCTTSDWAKGLPLDAELIESHEYLK